MSEINDVVRRTVTQQAEALEHLTAANVVEEIVRVVDLIDESDGRVVCTGIGKSGDIAQKISSTFSSIGVPSFFVHPVEAQHGDLGAISSADIVVLISNSGNTEEVYEMARLLKAVDATAVAITSNPDSKIARVADLHIDTGVEAEASLIDLVPMTSSTVTMVAGDAIANGLMYRKDFNREDFAHFHPGGTIGKTLLLTVEDIMVSEFPMVSPSDTLAETIHKMSQGGKGIAVIRDDTETVLGILTDGDVRRLIERGFDFHEVDAEEVMIMDPVTIESQAPALRALNLLEQHDITQIVVVDGDNRFMGVVHFHDIMQEGLGG